MAKTFCGIPCTMFLSVAMTSASDVNVNLKFGGSGGGDSELRVDRACKTFVGEGDEVCDKRQSGDCNKYAFLDGDTLYACQDDHTFGVCRKKLGFFSSYGYKHCPDGSAVEAQMYAEKERLQIEATHRLALEVKRKEDEALYRRQKEEAEAKAAKAKERAKVAIRQQTEERRRQEQQKAEEQLKKQEQMIFVAILATIGLIILYHVWRTLLRAVVYYVVLRVALAIAFGVDWCRFHTHQSSCYTFKMRLVATMHHVLVIFRVEPWFDDDNAGLAALLVLTYLLFKLLFWCFKTDKSKKLHAA